MAKVPFIAYLLMVFLLGSSVFAASHHPQEFLKQIHGSVNEAKEIYTHFCVNCHAKKPLIPLGAPKIADVTDWKWRMKQGLTMLLKNTDEGMNAMPPRGGCFECTDEQLLLAIQFMLPKTQEKK